MIVVCEGFYYVFKQLEEFEKLPVLGESIEKIKRLLMIMRNNTKGFHRSGHPLTEIIYKQAYQNEETLKFNFTNISNLFENFRYSFDKEQLGYNRGLVVKSIYIHHKQQDLC